MERDWSQLPPDPPQDTINAALARAVASAPSRIFLDFEGDTYSFADVDAFSTGLAHGLAAIGVTPGAPVATILDNNVDAVTVWLALNKLGAISAPVNTGLRGSFLRAQLADCNAAVIIAEADYAERILEVADGLPEFRALYVRSSGSARKVGAVAIAPLDALRTSARAPIADPVTPGSTAMLVYTSGTTGASKGCMIPHNLPCNMAWNAMLHRGNHAGDVLWSPLPLFHLNAIGVSVVGALIAQARASIARRFSVRNFWPEIERSGATVVSLLGSMASLVAEAPDSPSVAKCRGQIRHVNAAPFPPAVVARWRERFGIVSAGSGSYGMTEAATISTLGKGEPLGPPGSSGRPGIDFEVRIVNEKDEPLPAGTPGEIVCRPKRPNILFSGYWKRPEETLTAIRHLWFHTGDIGRLDADGFLYFVDRKKDYIRRRGENISTFEMEAVFRDHPALQDVAVHAVLSPLGEDDVKVTAELVPGATLTEEELCRWSIPRLPYFAVPSYIEFRESLPRSATGKVLKEQLRSEGKTATTWDREAAGVSFARR